MKENIKEWNQDVKERAMLYFKELLSAELKVPVHKIEEDVPMEEYGIDSVMVMQMTGKLEETFGTLPKTLFFEYQTIGELTEYFMSEYQQKLNEILGVQEKTSSNSSSEPAISKENVTLYFKELLSEELKVPKHKIEDDVPMEEYGIDSVMIMQMTNKLEEAFGVLPKTLFFEYRTIEEITGYFMEEHHQKLREILGTVSSSSNKDPDINSDKENGKDLNTEFNKVLNTDFNENYSTNMNGNYSTNIDGNYNTNMNENYNTNFNENLKKNLNKNLNKSLDKELINEEEYIPFITPGIEKKYQKRRFVSLKQEEKEGKEDKNSFSDIAIIGLAGKYPKAEDLNEYWENLKTGKNCITEIPENRFDYKAYYDQDKNKGGKINSKWGGFLDGVYEFDPLFFNISPHEAEIIDPQERLFLTCVHETLEDAGYTKEACSRFKENGMEGNIGVFVGALFEEYQFYGVQEQAQGNMIALNGSLSSIANRVSYFFNFHGPSMAVDTLCSSSLTAIHLACQSLQKGDCEMAVAGGVNVTVHPNKYVLLGQNNFLSSKGLCESFGDGGDGYVPGEGVGAILLKPLEKAAADGDHIYGIIKSTAINHGGKTNGYTVPNPNAQAEVVRRAYKKAGINPRTIGYIEAHGTGTALGDPIEISGLNKVFSEYTEEKQFCRIGSVKSNIGHCESAAGIAGITKILLQMKYGYLVPSLHSHVLNPNIDFNSTAFKVQQEFEPWKRCTLKLNGEVKEYPLTAGISSFGAGGSNAHIVIEEYIKPAVPVSSGNLSQQIYVFSARDEKKLKQYAEKHQRFIESHSNNGEVDTGSLFQDMAYTLQIGRESMQERIAIVASDLKEVNKKLQDYINGEEYIPNLYQGNTKFLTIKDVFEGAASGEFVKALIKGREYDKLAELWISGVTIDWNWLYSADTLPCLISIPTYPFAREEYSLAKPVIIQQKNNDGQKSGELPVVNEDNNFFYIPKWERMKESDFKTDRIRKSQKVLIIFGEASVGISSLMEKLYKDQEVIKAKLDTRWEKVSSYEYILDTTALSSFEKLLSEVKNVDTFIFFGGITAEEFDTDQLEYLDLVQEQSVMALYRLFKAMIKYGYESRSITLKVVTNNVHRILPDESCLPYAAGAYGLAKSAEKEFPDWQISGFDIDLFNIDFSGKDTVSGKDTMSGKDTASGKDTVSREGEFAVQSIINGNHSISKSEVAIRDNVRYIRKIYPVNLSKQETAGLKEGGVYLIIGGTGGIGLELSLHIAKKYHGKLVLTGRREINQEIEEKIKKVEARGGEALYVQGDVTDPESMAKVIRTAKSKFGKVNGVIHSALVLQDHSLRNMKEETLKQVLAPKVKGSVVLHNAIKEEELDFLMYFSSGQTFLGNQGQSNYTAACAFTDSFALYENEVLAYPVKLINWGYWGEVGIVAGDEYNRRLSASGIYPIQTQEGIDGIERILRSEMVQTLAIKASEEVLKSIGTDFNINISALEQEDNPVSIGILSKEDMPELGNDRLQIIDESFRELRKFTLLILLDAFQKRGIFTQKEQYYSLENIKKELHIIEKYNRLFDSMLDILGKDGVIVSGEGDTFTATGRIENEVLKSRLSRIEEEKDNLLKLYPMVIPYMELLWTCSRHFWEILSGECPATDIVFPDSSMKLVEKIYNGNEVSDYMNEVITWAVSDYIESRLKSLQGNEKIKILEIGAGTGGTSRTVFKGIRKYGERLQYDFTDISDAFLKYGEESFGAENPYVRFQYLNIEKDILSQGYLPGEFDMIIATNVLHATININNTVKNAKTLLKKNGWLILNENTKVEEVATLTFGLLDGWWLFEDESSRMKGSPLLSNEMWRNLLLEEGYRNVKQFGQPDKEDIRLHQNVIVSESDGEVKLPVKEGERKSPVLKQLKTGEQDQKSFDSSLNITQKDIKDVGQFIEAAILDCLAAVLKINKGELDINTPYKEYGVDSILSGQIINRISEKLGIELNSTALFNYPTTIKLKEFILKKYKDEIPMDLESNKSVEVQSNGKAEATDSEKTIDSEKARNSEEARNSKEARDSEESRNSGEVRNIEEAGNSGEVRISGEAKYTDSGVDKRKYSSIDNPSRNKLSSDDPSMNIAIVGVSGMFPGAATLTEYWENLCRGKNSVAEIDRWELDSFYDPDPQIPNKSYIKTSGMLADADKFDPLFFNISPREAELMDPQQRLFLQEAWKALEDAGFSDEYLDERKCGVYVGCNDSYYMQLIEESGIEKSNYVFTGNTLPILSARISYLLNLRGPSVVVTTACSSSLVALHQACASVITGDSEIAIAGGVNVFPTPYFHTIASSTGMLSYQDKCRPFDNKADGFIPAEGVGAVVLKKLDKAIEDGDHIYSVIVGTGINQDGKSNGITAPSAPSQAALEYEVYSKYKINPENISYIEAHGTGTKLGDPIEIEALSEAFAKFTDKKQFCAIGAVKANIGHALEASGMASLIKVLLCMKYKILVPSINYETGNELISFKDSPVYVNTELKPWTATDGIPRTAAISAFGISGTNSHMVMKEYTGEPVKKPISLPYHIVALSAKTEQALKSKLTDMVSWLEADKKAHSLEDIAYTLMAGRSHFSYRAAFIVKTADELVQELELAIDHSPDSKMISGDYISNNFRPEPEVQKSGNEVLEELSVILSGDSEYKQKLVFLGELYVKGYSLEWGLLYNSKKYKKVSLPTYPFARDRYWIESHPVVKADKNNKSLRIHPLIGQNTSTLKEQKYTTLFCGKEGFIKDHQINGKKIMPGAAYIEMARAGGEIAAELPVMGFKNLIWGTPIIITDSKEVNLGLSIEDGQVAFEIYTKDSGARLTHAQGILDFEEDMQEELHLNNKIELDVIKKRCDRVVMGDSCYASFQARGLNYGQSFQVIQELYSNSGEALAYLKLPAALAEGFHDYGIHPSILDGALQTAIGLAAYLDIDSKAAFVPFLIQEIKLLNPLETECYAHVIKVNESIKNNSFTFYITITNKKGEILAIIDGYNIRELKTEKDKDDDTLELLKQLENGTLTAWEVEKMMEEAND